MKKNHFACMECGGDGRMECPCCDSETDCSGCDGTGLDASKLNVAAFQAAEKKLFGSSMSWAWIGEDGVWKGRCNKTAFLAYEDYRRPAP